MPDPENHQRHNRALARKRWSGLFSEAPAKSASWDGPLLPVRFVGMYVIAPATSAAWHDSGGQSLRYCWQQADGGQLVTVTQANRCCRHLSNSVRGQLLHLTGVRLHMRLLRYVRIERCGRR